MKHSIAISAFGSSVRMNSYTTILGGIVPLRIEGLRHSKMYIKMFASIPISKALTKARLAQTTTKKEICVATSCVAEKHKYLLALLYSGICIWSFTNAVTHSTI